MIAACAYCCGITLVDLRLLIGGRQSTRIAVFSGVAAWGFGLGTRGASGLRDLWCCAVRTVFTFYRGGDRILGIKIFGGCAV